MSMKLFCLYLKMCFVSAFWNVVPGVQKGFVIEPTEFRIQKVELVVELAVFCDMDLGSHFEFDKQKILRYWEAVMYDVHLRFKTLPSFNVSFRVTSLQTFQKPEEQAIFEIKQSKIGSYSIDEVAGIFEVWVNHQRKHIHIPNFDIAIFVLGTDKLDIDGYSDTTNENTICVAPTHQEKRWLASIVLTMPNLVENLSRGIAHILGAPSDDDPTHWNICDINPKNATDCCIMSNSRPHRDIRPHFFSRCTDQILAKNLPDQMSCLDRVTAVLNPVIDIENLFKDPSSLYAYSMEEQCQLMLNETAIEMEFATCLVATCGSAASPDRFAFQPLDGSKCEKNGEGRCLRATCVVPQVQLVNVGTGKCLVPEDGQFSIHDKPVLRDCDKIPMDVLVGIPMGPEGLYVPTFMYSTENGPAFKHLKLTTDSNFKHVGRFDTGKGDLRSTWIIRRLADSKKEEFLLMHGVSEVCATATENSEYVEFTTECNVLDSMARWKFVKINEAEFNSDPLTMEFSSGYFVTEDTLWILIIVCISFVLLAIYMVIWIIRRLAKPKFGNKMKVKKEKIFYLVVRENTVKTTKTKVK